MPIYEYNCPKCGHFEAMQKVSDKPLKCKPDCDEAKCPRKAERIISASSFHLKGSGWYKTDYSSGSSSTSSTSTTKSVNKSDSSKGTSSDSGSTSSDKGTTGGKKGGCGSGCGCH